MTSPKNKRTPPRAEFDNYSVYHIIDDSVGVTDINSDVMTEIVDVNGRLELGFDFHFDGNVYRTANIVGQADGGTLMLRPEIADINNWDPDASSMANHGTGGFFADWKTTGLSETTKQAPWVILMPWSFVTSAEFNRSSLGIVEDLTNESLDNSPFVGKPNERFRYGLEPLNTRFKFNPAKHGIRYFHDDKSAGGRRFIVRWHIQTAYSNIQNSFLMFEACIYESGKIEFRYSPKDDKVSSAAFSYNNPVGLNRASVGIIASGTVETPKFRDFSILLGHGTSRQVHPLGGTSVTPGYFDVARDSSGIGGFSSVELTGSYGIGLSVTGSWPAGGGSSPLPGFEGPEGRGTRSGGMFVFSPPALMRKTLRSDISRDASQLKRYDRLTHFMSQKNNSFDDRKTVLFTDNVPVNMPSTLSRFTGTPSDALIRQNIFSDLDLTGSVSVNSLDHLLRPSSKLLSNPFSESDVPEFSSDSFFASGSSVVNGDTSLGQSLKSKTKFQISLPLDFKTEMMPMTSTIYYYNKRFKQWLTPRNSSYELTWLESGGGVWTGWGEDGTKSDLKNPYHLDEYNNAEYFALNDARGFGPIGNYLASGTQPLPVMNKSNFVSMSLDVYPKSLTIHPDYEANNDELISIPITQPFVLEKAVFKLPIEAGRGWFSDQTSTFSPIFSDVSSASYGGFGYDFAGPALTVALFHQHGVGASMRRSLILTGTITHTFDNIMALSASRFIPVTDALSPSYTVRPVGFKSYANPGAIVSAPSVNDSFTGSVTLNCEAAISNGGILLFSNPGINGTQARSIVSSSTLNLNGGGSDPFSFNIAYINSIGRTGTGLDTNGRSFGANEFQISVDSNAFENPFKFSKYIASGTLVEDIEQLVAYPHDSEDDSYRFHFLSMIPLMKHTVSPYVMLPGDKLIVSISKMRPFQYSMIDHVTNGISGSSQFGHDIKLNTGSLDITLYGSMLKENKEHHNTLMQQLSSDAVHEISIGNDPVLDQFEIENRDSYSAGFNDDYVTGSLVTISYSEQGNTSITIGSRSRVFSKLDASNVSKNYLELGSLVSEKLTPWYTQSGLVRFSTFSDDSELYYDSLVPNFTLCAVRNDYRLTSYTNADGALFALARLSVNLGSNTTVDNRWLRSFPFEPNYSGISRDVSLTRNIVTKRRIFDTANVTGIDIADEARSYDSLSVYTGDILFSDRYVEAISDVILGNRSLTQTDALKVLYGFGDVYGVKDGGGFAAGIQGTNYLPSYSTADNRASGIAAAPIIRGWRHGLISGIVTKPRMYWRSGRFGQFRDMLEQRLNTKVVSDSKVSTSPVSVRFVTQNGVLTNAENTWSSNLSFEVTSSVPYFDGETRNRNDINVNTINQGIVTFNNDNGNITI
jgi:hypothetical protein